MALGARTPAGAPRRLMVRACYPADLVARGKVKRHDDKWGEWTRQLPHAGDKSATANGPHRDAIGCDGRITHQRGPHGASSSRCRPTDRSTPLPQPAISSNISACASSRSRHGRARTWRARLAGGAAGPGGRGNGATASRSSHCTAAVHPENGLSALDRVNPSVSPPEWRCRISKAGESHPRCCDDPIGLVPTHEVDRSLIVEQRIRLDKVQDAYRDARFEPAPRKRRKSSFMAASVGGETGQAADR
ncbi:hypothetical protein FHS96_005514 [Sphingomonas zeicaulis]